jgi:hypothetical protein
MTDLPLENRNRPSPDAGDLLYDGEIYVLPILPRLCLIANTVSAMLACVLAVLVSIANSRANIDIAVLLSKLIFWFLTGALVAFLSAVAEYAARFLYRMEARSGPSFWKFGEVVDCTAVAMGFASAGVFCWSVWLAFSALRAIDIHF